jgi:hypothetical protein
MRMTDYIRQLENPRFAFEKQEAERLVHSFDEAEVKDGVVRWKSNGSVPPNDVMDLWEYVGKVFDKAKSQEARDKDIDTFAAAYRIKQSELTAEQKSERKANLRAAYGRGTVVVDVLTGEKTTT